MRLPLAHVSLPSLVTAVGLVLWFPRCVSALALATPSLHPPTLTSERMEPVSCSPVHLARCRFTPVSILTFQWNQNSCRQNGRKAETPQHKLRFTNRTTFLRYFCSGAIYIWVSWTLKPAVVSTACFSETWSQAGTPHWQHFLPLVPWEWGLGK